MGENNYRVVDVSLITTKAKVTPFKRSGQLPLDLQLQQVLGEIKVQNVVKINIIATSLWTDIQS